MDPLDVPSLRIQSVNAAPLRDGEYVLYWMIAARRTRWNFGLQRAVEHCERLGLPLVVFEPLRCGHRWASQRIHAFVAQGMADNAVRCRDAGVAYFPYLEPNAGDGTGLLAALAQRAAVVVTDTFPSFFLPRMVQAAGRTLDVALEEVDANGIIPLSATEKASSRAFDFRRVLHRILPDHIDQRPLPEPLLRLTHHAALGELVPGAVLERWPAADPAGVDVAAFPVDSDVPPVPFAGGSVAGEAVMARFLDHGLHRYHERNHPDEDVASGLSPYLHFGHVSAHEVVGTLLDDAEWTAPSPPLKPTGARSGWWGLGEARESFLDEIITWREVGYVFCHHTPDYDQYESLPNWARISMDATRDDPRPAVYSLDELEQGQTGDPLWNAAQRQLRVEGRIHNYLRMLWGKRIYEWSPTPEEAWRRLEHINNRWSLDGRNPNSYSGIGWVMGRFDRAWGPVRPIYGKLRYMTSASTRRKLKLKRYLAQWEQGEQSLF